MAYKLNAITGELDLVEGGSGATTFLGLTDTPSDYTGEAGNSVRVNVAEDALEYYTPVGDTDEKVKYNALDTAAGYLADKTIAGTGISLAENLDRLEITNSSPDQTVSLTAGAGISVAGTYPSFTITNTGEIVSVVGGTDITVTEAPDDTYTIDFNNSTGYITAGDIDWGTNVPLNETDPVYSSWIAGPPNVSEFTNDSGYISNVSGEDHSSLNNLGYASAGHTGFEPTVTKGDLTETTSDVLTITEGTGAVIGSGLTIEVDQADTTNAGYLSSTDWNTFNNKEGALSKSNLTASSPVSISNTPQIIGSSAADISIDLSAYYTSSQVDNTFLKLDCSNDPLTNTLDGAAATFTGAIQGLSLTDGTASLTGGNLTVGDGNSVGSTTYKWLFDETNGDITTTAKVGIGTATPISNLHISVDGTTPHANLSAATDAFVVSNDGASLAMRGIVAENTNANRKAGFTFIRARGTLETPLVVQNGDSLGEIGFQGFDGTTRKNAAAITAHVDAGAGASDMPARLSFWTTPNGSTTLAENMRITNAGDVKIPNDSSKLYFGAGDDAYFEYDGADFKLVTDAVAASDFIVDCGTEKTLELTEKVFEDVQFGISNAKVPASNAPVWQTFTPNTNEYGFGVDDLIDCEANELPHSWKEGSNGRPHLHITTKAANTSGANEYAKFTVVFAYADTDEVWTESSFTAELTIPNGTAALTNFFLDLGADLVLTNYLIGAQVKVRVERIDATSGDPTEYPGEIFLTQVGLHIAKDTLGSRQLLVK